MSWRWTRRTSLWLRAVAASAVSLLISASAIAGVTSSTDQRNHTVEGTSARALVRSLNANAFEGDHGRAYASIHPDYQLSMTTREASGICRPARVDVHVAFDLTLPVANTGGLSRSTRAAWNNFASFARAHENHHKASYLGCAAAFVAQARRQSAPSCFELEDDVRRMLYDMKRSCEIRQRPFDQSQARILRGLSLFVLARR